MARSSPSSTDRPLIAALAITVLLLSSAALLVCLALRPAAAEGLPDPATLIRGFLQTPGELVVQGTILDGALLKRVYEARNFEPVWAAPTMAGALAEVLAAAQSDGIDADQSGAGAVAAVLADPGVTATERELVLTDRYLAYARMLTQGAVAPAGVETDWAMPRPSFEPMQAMALLDHDDRLQALAAMAPQTAQYGALKDALQRYRAIAAHGGWLALPTGIPIEPGMIGALVHTLRARLVAEGDLQTTAGSDDAYDPTTSAAVQHFQARHGLSEDGRVGAGTLRALNVPAADRIGQISLNLERLRSLPHTWPTTRIEVNVAAATLTLYRDGQPILTSRVIVGAPKHPTPVFTAQAVAILLNPPWNVPSSIVRNEFQPALRRSADYLARNHLVLLGPGADEAQGLGVDWRTTTVLGQGWRVQQAPGPWNALGRIKLELPNSFDVYLHDTPARTLFAQPMRALSHGCIRVEAVHQLAEMLLDRPADKINEAIDAGATVRLPLSAPVPVDLLYLTAFVDPDGTVEFRDDIYGRDRRLAAALVKLKAEQRSLKPPGPTASTSCSIG